MMPVFADGNYRLSGGFGGGGAGYNLQFSRFVLGIEGSIGDGRMTGSSPACGSSAHTCGTSVSAVSDVRGRVGYSFGNLLPYVTGGLAVDLVNAYDNMFNMNGSGWRAGYTVGAGLEYKVTVRLSIRAEYLHTEIGSAFSFNIVPGVPERVALRSDAARLSLNFATSDPGASPVIAKY